MLITRDTLTLSFLSISGPSASISYLLAGIVAALVGLPYAELSAAFPLDGSTYSYAYITLGEVFAVMASLCQSLEYGGASAAVARSWGSKFVDWLEQGRDQSNPLPSALEKFLHPGYGINPMGAIIALFCSLLLLWGVKESKMATNIFSATKVSLVIFMIVAGFLLASGVFPNSENTPASFSNWIPFVPPQFGSSGILDGSSILFFAFLGFDQICNLSGEAKNPVKDVPRAVILTLMIDGVVYMLAALALTAMLPYKDINTVSAFPRAFEANGVKWAEMMTAIGEIVTLPLVVLTGIQSQTRLFFAMSKDKLLPIFFGKLTFSDSRKYCCVGEKKEDRIGNLSANIMFCGVVIIILACFVPFQYIESLISAGALFLFSLTDVCLLMIRYKCPSESFLGNRKESDDNASIFSIGTVREQLSLGRLLILLNVFPFVSGCCFAFIPIAAVKYSLAVLFALLTLCVTLYMASFCPQANNARFLEGDGYGRSRFRTPLVPYLPALGIFANWFMLAHVGWQGIVMLLVYLFLGVLIYGGICSGKSLTCEHQTNDGSFTNLLPGRISPISSATSPLQDSLLHDREWEDEEKNKRRNLNRDLSEIETSKSVRFV